MRATTLMGSALVLAGCASVPEFDTVYPPLEAGTTVQRLVVDSPFGAADDADVLAMSPSLVLFVQDLNKRRDTRRRLEDVANLFRKNGDLGMSYGVDATLTATQAFEQRRGNCLTFTHLFIAIAREMGLRVRYQEVLGVERWDTVGDYLVLNRHIAAFGNFPESGSFVVDFGEILPRDRRFGRLITDDRARAQHFNNLGAEALTGGDIDAGIALFNRSILIDPEVHYVWTNLGTAYLQLGRYREAEWAYAEARRLRPYDVSAINQTASLYGHMGRADLAEAYRKLSERERRRNPYYLFREGVLAMESGDLNAALDNLRRAAKRQPDELHFFLQLGKVHAMRAEPKAAKRAFVHAEGLIETDADRLAVTQMLLEVCGQFVTCRDENLVELAPPTEIDAAVRTPHSGPWG